MCVYVCVCVCVRVCMCMCMCMCMFVYVLACACLPRVLTLCPHVVLERHPLLVAIVVQNKVLLAQQIILPHGPWVPCIVQRPVHLHALVQEAAGDKG
jgi:hypothetical protein